ncbi:MAG: SRPBCC domain-containing protein [Flavipsychrobacter sp.]
MGYTTEIIIEAMPADVFNALTKKVQDWWGYTDNEVKELADIFTTSFDKTFWKFEITEYVPNKKLTWTCIDARHVHEGYNGIEKEWLGTKVKWELVLLADRTKVYFEHEGLEPELNCYELCSTTWEMFLVTSLKKYVETGIGKPSLM